MENKVVWILFFLILIVFYSCDSGSKNKVDDKPTLESDNCTNAVEYENAIYAEQLVAESYTGELKNYMGEDTTRIDFIHEYDKGQIKHSTFYYYNGHKQEEYWFQCRSLHGDIKFYHENGELAILIPYVYGRRDGEGYMYDSLGTVLQKVVFKNDSILEEVHYDK